MKLPSVLFQNAKNLCVGVANWDNTHATFGYNFLDNSYLAYLSIISKAIADKVERLVIDCGNNDITWFLKAIGTTIFSKCTELCLMIKLNQDMETPWIPQENFPKVTKVCIGILKITFAMKKQRVLPYSFLMEKVRYT
jgi:hypothetical protein